MKCIITIEDGKKIMPFEEFHTLVSSLPQENITEITLYGELAKIENTKKYFSLKKKITTITTNGSSPVDRLPKVKNMVFFLRYPLREMHDNWTKYTGSFNNCMKLIRLCRKDGINPYIFFEMDLLNYKYLRMMHSFSRENGTRLYPMRYIPKNDGFLKIYLSDVMWEQLQHDCTSLGISCLKNNDSCLGKGTIHIDIDGDVTVCPHAKKKIVKIGGEIFPRIISMVNYEKEKYENMEICPRIIELKTELLKPRQIHELNVLYPRVRPLL